MKARLVYPCNVQKTVDVMAQSDGAYTTFRLSRDVIGENCVYVDFLFDCFTAKQGNAGYFVLPFEAENGVHITRFTPREDTEHVSVFSCMGCYGWNKGESGIRAIVTGMK